MATKKDLTSAELKQKLVDLDSNEIKSRYLLPAGDYNPTDVEFMNEIIKILNTRDDTNHFIHQNIIPFFAKEFDCYDDFASIMYTKILTNTLKYGYKLNLKNYLEDLEKLLRCRDNNDWIASFCAGDKKTCKQFNELTEFIGCKLVLPNLIAKNISTL